MVSATRLTRLIGRACQRYRRLPAHRALPGPGRPDRSAGSGHRAGTGAGLAVGSGRAAGQPEHRAGLAPARHRASIALPAACACAAAPLVWLVVRRGTGTPLALPVSLAALTVASLLVLSLADQAASLAGACRRGRDDVTGLLGRRAFIDAAAQVVAAATAPEPAPARSAAALLLVDLDRFRDINDTLGHVEGDRLLHGVGQRLRSALGAGGSFGAGGLLGRIGADAFAVMLADADQATAELVAQQLRDELRAPLPLAQMPVQALASIGIALAPTHGRTVSDLLARAEEAMYEAKRQRAGQRVFDSGCRQSSPARLRMRAELASAFDDDQLELRYQPKADLRTGRVIGVEALVRWRHPVDGVRSPDLFLPEMERAGLLPALTDRVLGLALSDCVRWYASGAPLAVSVNVPASVIVEEAFVDVVRDALAQRGLPPAALTIEVTEDGLIAARDRAQGTLAGLRAAGVRVSLDDYGTGFCSLAYLRDLPADELKLDRMFLSDIEHSASAVEIVRSTVGLAHALGLIIVAEGVESAGSWAALGRWGCDAAQGYFVSPPLAADRVLGWTHEWWQRLRELPGVTADGGARAGAAPARARPGDPTGSEPPADGPPGGGPGGRAPVDRAPGALAAVGPPGAAPGFRGRPGLWPMGSRMSQRGDGGSRRPGGSRGRTGRQLSSS